MKSNAIIIILSYPDTVVRPAYWEKSSKIWPKIGIGNKHAVQAGHAALVLIKKGEVDVNYFDFGRYITSYGNGRVRCKETDPELYIPVKATFTNNVLNNLEEILLWLESNPEKTHGDGRLVATTNTEINFEKAQNHIHSLIKKKEIPYGAFIKKGTNCARFVTDTLIASSNNRKIKKQLQKSNLFTPSPIGNVIKATTENKIFTVLNKRINLYKNRSILKEYRESFFNKFNHKLNLIGTELPNPEIFYLKKGTWLGGIGSGAWFHIEEKVTAQKYKIARYDDKGIKNFESIFSTDKNNFNHLNKHQFVYPTNCLEVYIIQKNEKFIFKK